MKARKTLNSIKGGLAVGSAIATFMAYALPCYSAYLYKLFSSKDTLPDFYRRIPGHCANTMETISQRLILGIRTEILNTLPKTDPQNERQVFIVNHPTNNGLPTLMNYLTSNFAPHLISVSKKENLRHPTAPLNIWPLNCLDAIVFIDRNNPKAAIEEIRNSCQRVLTNNAGLMIFPDSKRPTEKAIKWSIERHGPIPDLEKQYSCHPRPGGLWAIREATKDFNTRFISVTNTFDQKDQTLSDAGNLSGATLYFDAKDVTQEIPETFEDLSEWLVKEWQEKNRLIHNLKSKISEK